MPLCCTSPLHLKATLSQTTARTSVTLPTSVYTGEEICEHRSIIAKEFSVCFETLPSLQMRRAGKEGVKQLCSYVDHLLLNSDEESPMEKNIKLAS